MLALQETLDPALTRPGRFDRKVAVPMPDVRGRLEILEHYLKVCANPVQVCNHMNSARLVHMLRWVLQSSRAKALTALISEQGFQSDVVPCHCKPTLDTDVLSAVTSMSPSMIMLMSTVNDLHICY